MIYRAQTPTGDFMFGQNNRLVNSPAAVAQAVKTRLQLIQGEWFLDTSAGVPYQKDVLGKGTLATAPAAILAIIRGTIGVTSVLNFLCGVNPQTRTALITFVLVTIYGSIPISMLL